MDKRTKMESRCTSVSSQNRAHDETPNLVLEQLSVSQRTLEERIAGFGFSEKVSPHNLEAAGAAAISHGIIESSRSDSIRRA